MDTRNIKIKTQEYDEILHYTGFVLICISLFMYLPIVTSYILNDNINYMYSFILSSLISLFLGLILYFNFKSKNLFDLSLKGSILFVVFIWVVVTLISALPLIFSGDLSFIDSYFEAMSATTSTGFTMYSSTPSAYSIRLWRCLLQWFGGLGMIFLIATVIPSSKSLKRLFFAEGKTEKMTPNIKHTTKIFIKLYALLTFIFVLLYLLAGLDFFNSVCYTFSGLGTGGFSADPTNLNNFSNPLIRLITMIVMIIGATNFLIFYKMIKSNWKVVYKSLEVKYMFIIIFLATTIVSFSLYQYNFYDKNILLIIQHALFQVISILTSTGFQTTDINNWPSLSYHVLILLMFIGGSLCSTASGIKIYNVVVMIKAIWWEIQSMFSPNHIVVNRKVFHNNAEHSVTPTLINHVVVFIATYLLLFIISTFIVLVFCNDFRVAYTIVAGSIGNTGLGPNYINVSIPLTVKIVLIIDFLAGRLSIWPIIIPVVYMIQQVINGVKSL